MKTESFQKMESEYKTENGKLEVEYLEERTKMLSRFKYSVIIEGEHSEFDNLDKWIKQNINQNGIENIYYGKTGYDYGFAEYFTNEIESEKKLNIIVSNIYTTYPDASPSRLICRSNGYDLTVEYSSSNINAIIFPAE